MNTQNKRIGIDVLSDADMEKVGTHIVGGISFKDGADLTLTLVSIAGLVSAAFCACMNPENRLDWWNSFISNFNRTTVAGTADAAGDIESASGDLTAASYLETVNNTLDNASISNVNAITAVQTIMGGTWAADQC